MPPRTPKTTEGRQLPIPSRSPSISRTSRASQDNRHKMAARCSLIEDSTGHMGFLSDDPNASTMRTSSSPPPSRTQSPSRVVRRPVSCATSSRNPVQSSYVQRWAGLTRSVCSWDGLRKDPELWVQEGDCAVHLYARGSSRRGPSFSVPLRALRQKRCSAMLDICDAQMVIETSNGSQESRRLRTFDNLNRDTPLVNLYIPAPEKASREESFDWHLATRNFFAFILGKPLVGRSMGQAFVDLFERMEIFRSGQVENHQDFLEYAENQGYRDLVECTDYALASLYYAERYKLKDVWIDAFAHCVGMNESLALSPEYASVSRLSKALITRAHLEVDMHLERVAKALRSFLEEDFSPAYLGLTAGARAHLHSFQRFLHQLYAAKFGYWPPPMTSSFPKVLYKSLFYDFQSLYDLLADTRSNADIASQMPSSGGICVLQTVDDFDKRHKFDPLPHCLPLLPDVPSETTARSLPSGSFKRTTREVQAKHIALDAATNTLTQMNKLPPIVSAFRVFEKVSATNSGQREENITSTDARKVQWLLIYGILQYLTSALRAPKGVRDVESPEYPLCCIVAGQSSWNKPAPISTPSTTAALSPLRGDYFEKLSGSPTIQPDCNREDYFAPASPRREASNPVKTLTPSRRPSMRSFSLSARTSRRNSLTLKPNPHCPIIIRGYGDGLNEATTSASPQAAVECRAASHAMTVQDESSSEVPWLQPRPPPVPVTAIDGARGHTRTRTPLLLTVQLDQPVQHADAEALSDAISRSDSTGSKSSSVWSDEGSAASSKSSYRASTAEHSGLLGGLVSVDGTRVSLEMPVARPGMAVASQKDIHPLFRNSMVEQGSHVVDLHGHHQQGRISSKAAGSIGMALSAPQSPPLHSASATEYALQYRTMALASQKTHYVHVGNEAKSNPTPEATAYKKSRSSEFLSGIMSSPTELRDRYNHAMKRLDHSGPGTQRYEDLCNRPISNAHTPTVTKTSHAARMPSLRSRIWNDDGRDRKKENRLSSFWRR